MEPDYLKFDIALVRSIDRSLDQAQPAGDRRRPVRAASGPRWSRKGSRRRPSCATPCATWACRWDRAFPGRPRRGGRRRRRWRRERAHPPYHERIPGAGRRSWPSAGASGVIVLGRRAHWSIEDAYGSDAYDEVRQPARSRSSPSSGARTIATEDILCPRHAARPPLHPLPRAQAAAQQPAVRGRPQGGAQPPRLVAGRQPGPGRLPVHQDSPPHRGRLRDGRLQPFLHAERILPPGGGGGLDDAAYARRGEAAAWCGSSCRTSILRERVVTALPGHHGADGPDGAGLRGAVARARGARAWSGADAPLRRRGGAPASSWSSTACAAGALLSLRAHPVQRQDLRQHACPPPSATRQFRGKALIDFLDKRPGLARPHRHRDHGEARHRQLQPLPRRPWRYFTDLRDVASRSTTWAPGYSGPGVHRPPEAART